MNESREESETEKHRREAWDEGYKKCKFDVLRILDKDMSGDFSILREAIDKL